MRRPGRGHVGGLRALLLGLRFLLELCALAALAVWGGQAGESVFVDVLLAVAAPVVAAVVWGAFVAPRAAVSVREPVRMVIELVVFGAAGLALAEAGHVALGVVFVLVAVANGIAVRVVGGLDEQ